MEFINFDWHLQGYTNNGSHSKLNTDRHSNSINMIFHNRKVQLFLYVFPKSQVLATKTFGVREVQSWRTILTVKIGYTLCVKTRFWVLLWNAWEFKSFNGIPFKLSGSLEHKLNLLGAKFLIYLRWTVVSIQVLVVYIFCVIVTFLSSFNFIVTRFI